MLFTLALTLLAPLEPSFGSCAWVRAENDGTGTGFVVDADKRLLVTCRHVVGDRKQVDVFFPWVRDGALVTDRAEYLRNRAALRERGLLATGTVLKTSDGLDLALLELASLPPGTTAATLSARPPHPGDQLRVIGNRLDLDTVWNVTRGPLRVTGALKGGYFWRGKKLALDTNALIAQLPTEEGDSGGPVFDSRNEVVGVDSALRRACPLAAVAVSASDVRTFLGARAEPAKGTDPHPVAEALTRATVWVKPTATDVHLAGVLIEKNLVLTAARGLAVGNRVGVALPLRAGDRWVSERAEYTDPLGVQLRGAWRSGAVLARDPARDLALIRLESGSGHTAPLKLADAVPGAGAPLHALSHPSGLEFAWVYASGSVRQRGPVALEAGEKPRRVDALVCQLPAQTGSPGGPIANDRGELVGVLSAREGAQQVGYAATAAEIRAFLDVARRDRPPETLAGLVACLDAIPSAQQSLLARALAQQGEMHRTAGRREEAQSACAAAVRLDPGCPEARLCRALMAEPEAALAELGAAVETGPFNRNVLVWRSVLALDTKDFRKARGDADRVLDVFPADVEARDALARAHLGLGDDAKAATALGDMVRADPAQMKAVAGTVHAHAAALEQKFPGSPGIVADWFVTALGGVQKGARDPDVKRTIAELLKTAGATTGDTERLKVLRAGVQTWR